MQTQPPTTATWPQFSLKAVFAALTWLSIVAGLAVSQIAGWTMVFVGFSLAVLNCAGRLTILQSDGARPRVFQLGWVLLALSLFLPAVKGCNNQSVVGWQAAVASGSFVLDPPGTADWPAVVWYGVLTFGNLLLVLSPWYLWRLSRGQGQVYRVLFAATNGCMWSISIGDAGTFLLGYYVWCLAGLAMLCASPLRWPAVVVLSLGPLGRICFTQF
jgi:hypothetical protein